MSSSIKKLSNDTNRLLKELNNFIIELSYQNEKVVN